MNHPVKALIVNHYSETDQNGNRYWLATVTNLQKSRHTNVSFHTGGEHNAIHMLRQLGFDWDDTLELTIGHPKRQFQNLVKGVNIYEHTAEQQLKTLFDL
jgi:hypothetical protein